MNNPDQPDDRLQNDLVEETKPQIEAEDRTDFAKRARIVPQTIRSNGMQADWECD
jgi:hypothetical protein